MESERSLAARVAQFRTAKEHVKAQYTAAKAGVRVGEAVTGRSADMADLAIALRRAQDRTQELRELPALNGAEQARPDSPPTPAGQQA